MSASTNAYRTPDSGRDWGLSTAQLGVVAIVSLLTLASRLIDSPVANLSTMAALALFAGTVIRHPIGILLPLAIRVLTDGIVHLQTGYGFFPSWPFDYSAYVLIYVIGIAIPKRPLTGQAASPWRLTGRIAAVLGGTSLSVAIYFGLSNFGVWKMWPDTYPPTAAGLIDCFTKALPFVKGTIWGNMIAGPLFYAAWYLVSASVVEEQRVGSLLASADE